MRVVLSLPLILFLPGYGITALLFSRRALDIPARLLLSVGLSLATTAFTGLILHLSPWGVRLENPLASVLLGGTGLVGVFFLVRDALHINRKTSLNRIGFGTSRAILMVFAVAIAAIALNVARTPASPYDLAGYTLLWVQPTDNPGKLALGVRSEEFDTTKYQLMFEIDDVRHDGPTFELKPGEVWESSLNLPKDEMAEQPVTVLLYRLENPNEVYRRVIWWNEIH